MSRFPRLLYLLLFLFFHFSLFSQCTDALVKILGSAAIDERGYAIVASETDEILYVSATIDDSLAIIKLNTSGQILWIRTLDIVKERAVYVNGMILDAEGMLGIAGTIGGFLASGNSFVCRYDPDANILLWSKELMSTSNQVCSGLFELPATKQYLFSSNPFAPNDAELVALDRQTGALQNTFSKHYDLGSSETIFDMVHYNGVLYGIGRFTDGPSEVDMRTSLFRMNPADGTLDWTKLGHRPAGVNARLYGVDLIADKNQLYFTALGDDDGGSITATDIFIHKANLDGNVSWVKRYNLPGTNDWVHEMIKSKDGFVLLASNGNSPSDLIVFKINTEGQVQWAKKFDCAVNDNGLTFGGVTSQMLTLGDHIYFTAFATEAGNADIILVKMNDDGTISDSCMPVTAVDIEVTDVADPVFYDAEPEVFPYTPQAVTLSIQVGREAELDQNILCGQDNQVTVEIFASICEGESYEGYTATGTYADTFTTAEGCDSTRILSLTVEACQPDCGALSSNIFGEAFVDEQGRCITSSTFEPAVYIAGNRDNNTLLIKVDLNGDIIWTRVLDLVEEGDEVPAGITEDSDGMLVVVGTGMNYIDGGVVYAFRYDPAANSILWANQYIHSPNDMAWGVIEKVPGGNYVFNLQPNFYVENYLDAEVVEIDRNTGETVTTLSKNYRIIGTETLFEIAYHDGAIYGTGRYKDGGEIDDLRTTLVKLDGDDGDQQWVKMGHRITEHPARLYGDDLVIENETIYVFSHGDPDGQSTTNTDIFIQKTDLNGNLIWIYEYELPGEADYTHDIIAADGGLIVLSVSLSEEQFYMFKIDSDGSVLWGQQYVVSGVTGDVEWERGNPLLTKAGDHYFFTGCVINSTGDKDLLIVQTDLEGHVSEHCLHSEAINIDQITLDNIAWYDRAVNQFEATHEVTGRQPQIEAIELLPSAACSMPDTLFSEFTITICQGQSFEDYTESGIYQDTFVTAEGCDSLRVLFLTVYSCSPIITYDLDLCRSYMSDGSIMDYSEFIPEYPNTLSCGAIEATNLYRTPPQENKHSCTEGLGGTLAMCISALNTCTYLPGNAASAVMEFTVTPDTDSIIAINRLEFYEKAPAIYSWIDGPSGPNNYPRYYGIRILKNGTQIFEQHDISTSLTWALQTYNFNADEAFKVSSVTTFRIELLPYCPVGNGAAVSAWDLEDIQIFASCVPAPANNFAILGIVSAWNDLPLEGVKMNLSEEELQGAAITHTLSDGAYRFDDLRPNTSYTVKGEKRDDVLQGVSTLDLITIQKHLLGIQPFTTLDQFIAADINHSGTINAMDMLALRKTLLGIFTEFPNNTSWRYGVRPLNLETDKPEKFVETAYMEELNRPETTVDLLGIKIGDVNRDLHTGLQPSTIEIRSTSAYPVYMDIMSQTAGTPANFIFRAGESIELLGIQLGIELKNLTILNFVPGAIPITAEHMYVSPDGDMRLSWNVPVPISISQGDMLFELTVVSSSAASISEVIATVSKGIKSELYTSSDTRELDLQVRKTDTTQRSFRECHFEIDPNPYETQLNLQFEIPDNAPVQFRFFTPLGKLIYFMEKEYLTGRHTEMIQVGQLSEVPSVLFCQMVYNNTVLSGKVIKAR